MAHEETHDLVAGLPLEAGRITEEMSSELALRLPDEPEAVGEQLGWWRTSAVAVWMLISAAELTYCLTKDRSRGDEDLAGVR